jgi:hypothetical protein
VKEFLKTISLIGERWVNHKNTPYWISDHGRLAVEERVVNTGIYHQIRKVNPPQLLKLHPEKDGYLQFRCCYKGIKTVVKIHRLVADYFVDNLDPILYNQVNHKDGNKSENHYKNLEWTSHLGNMSHAKELKLFCSGEEHHLTKLSTDEVVAIKSRLSVYKRGLVAELAREYGVNRKNISDIKNGRTWAHV